MISLIISLTTDPSGSSSANWSNRSQFGPVLMLFTLWLFKYTQQHTAGFNCYQVGPTPPKASPVY